LNAQLFSGSETDQCERKGSGLQKVPAIGKCFAILDLITGSRQLLGVTEISTRLRLSKSTVFNIVRTLADLEILEHRPNRKLAVGTRLYFLGKAASSKADLVRTVHPYLKTISRESRISSYLLERWGMDAVIVDKWESSAHMQISYEIGTRLPLVVGASGKALLCQLSQEELDNILCENGAHGPVPNDYKGWARLRNDVIKVRATGIADDIEEHIKGVIALAVPINTHRADRQAAILALGLKWQWRDGRMFSVSKRLKEISAELDRRFSTV
jgi:DNA-binding IclR family transcriptional regulator